MTESGIRNILVTGGAGFIGSSLVPVLLSRDYHVTVLDHFSAAKKSNIDIFFPRNNFEFIELDLLDIKQLEGIVKRHELVFHLSGNTAVHTGHLDTEADYLNNIVATRNLLECMRTSDRCKRIIFTSSSAVYGEPLIIPTPEDYGPLKPISMYGASKLACEALISGYSGTFGIQGVIFRLANVVGPSSRHGVIFDFIRKITESNGRYLEILGDGRQKKSYLYIDDCINALTTFGMRQSDSNLEILNVGSDDQIDINSIAQIIISELGYQTELRYLAQYDGGRGWIGDIRDMLLSTEKLKKMGWKIPHSSKDSVYLTVMEIIANKHKR